MRIARAALEEIQRHAEEGYPDEVCGIMIGPAGGEEVTEVRRARNLNQSMAATRYDMDPRDQLRVQREADERGLEILGYYHSHPDHGAYFSKTDEAAAWMNVAYLVVACNGGRVDDRRAFVALADHGPVREEPVEVV